MTTLKPVTRSAPCQVCGGDHKCSKGADGLILCGRRSGPQPGFAHLGPAKDELWSLYRAEGDRVLADRERERGYERIPARVAIANWQSRAEEFAAALTPAAGDDLCERIGLPRVALDALPLLGFDAATQSWTLAEEDGRGRVVGITRRFRDGSKRAVPGSQRGLTVPVRWSERGTALCIVEGASDVLALSLCGISCVGRPSNTGGVDHLAALLSSYPSDRQIIVLGEHDSKPDGAWPGRDGAIRVASALAAKLRRRIAWGLPPDGAKDARAWVLSRRPDPAILDSWHDIGDTLWG